MAGKKSSISTVATCNQNCRDGNVCGGKTSDAYDNIHEKSDAMACCWHRDGCPGGHDERNYTFK